MTQSYCRDWITEHQGKNSLFWYYNTTLYNCATPVFLGFPYGSAGKESTCDVGHLVQSLGWEDPLEKGNATHSSILAWEILWTERPDRLRSKGSQKSWTRLSIKALLTCHSTIISNIYFLTSKYKATFKNHIYSTAVAWNFLILPWTMSLPPW